MKKWKRFKACVIDHLVITDKHITIEVVIKSCRKKLYVACFDGSIEKENIPNIKNNDFSNFFMRGHYYGFGVNWKGIHSQAIDWSGCVLSEKLQRKITA
jgi:hypothetical protein